VSSANSARLFNLRLLAARHGNLAAYSVALDKYGFGILQTLERRSRLYFEYTIPILEKLMAAAR
jgi:hypothetical protein